MDKLLLFVSSVSFRFTTFFSVLTWQLGIRLQNICKKKKKNRGTTINTNTGWNAILPAICCGVTETQIIAEQASQESNLEPSDP